MRPYVNDRVGRGTRSRTHNGRNFGGKRPLRRSLEKSERQHGREIVSGELLDMEQERLARAAEEERERQELIAFDVEQSLLLQAGYYDGHDPFDDGYDDDWGDEYYRYGSRSCDLGCSICDDDYYDKYDQMDRDAERELQEWRGHHEEPEYDWDMDPEFVERTADAARDREHQPEVDAANAAQVELEKWKGRKR